jgi:DNA gyrase subunit A
MDNRDETGPNHASERGDADGSDAPEAGSTDARESETAPDELNPDAAQGKITTVDFDQEMKESYLDYSMSVIVGRALPDVRDGLKPVHRRVLYGMYAGRYFSERSGARRQFYKCARVVGDVMGNFHPHGDTAIYDTLVRMTQNWNLRHPLIDGQGNFGSRGDSKAAAMRYTECLMGKLALEMVRDIDRETVDFAETYDGRSVEPVVLPARFPNLLVNGSSGIAVGMATNIPTHNLKEIASAVQFYLEHFAMDRGEMLENLIKIVPGPDFPTGGSIIGYQEIHQAYRTGRGIITLRGQIETVEENGKVRLVIRELPYQVNPDRLMERLSELVRNGVISGISTVEDYSSGREGLNIVIGLKSDAVPKVVINNLYRHTALQESFGCNMVALVDGVPKTLSLDKFIEHWVNHQIDVILRRSRFIQRKAQERQHILNGYLKALDRIDEVVKLIRGSRDVEQARLKLIDLLTIDEEQAKAILAMQLARLAALEHQKIAAESQELLKLIADMQNILDTPERQRSIIGEELSKIVEEYGDQRRTQILPAEGDFSDEAFIKEENIVISISADGYIKRTNLDLFRTQHRGGKGLKGAKLRADDLIKNLLTTTTHRFILFFTNQGRIYITKGYAIPNAGRDTKGQHVANLLQLQGDEKVVEIASVRNFESAQYLLLATKFGQVKKTPLIDYSRTNSKGVWAIKLTSNAAGEVDEVVAAKLLNDNDKILLVSKNGQALKFTANAKQLRSLSRHSLGARGMRFAAGDELLTADIVTPDSDVLIVTESGFAKRSSAASYRETARGGKGIRVAGFDDRRGKLAGALTVHENDELLVIMESGKMVRSLVREIRLSGRTSKGVIFARPAEGDRIVEIARNFIDADA